MDTNSTITGRTTTNSISSVRYMSVTAMLSAVSNYSILPSIAGGLGFSFTNLISAFVVYTKLETVSTAHSFFGVDLDISNLFFQLSKYYNVIVHS